MTTKKSNPKSNSLLPEHEEQRNLNATIPNITIRKVRNAADLRRYPKYPEGLSRTKQSFAPDCDINAIVRRWASTGVLEHQVLKEPRYGDFSTGGDYLGALTRVQEADDNFMQLPVELRNECDNDPSKFIEWTHNPENRKALEEKGLGEYAAYLHGPEDTPPKAPGSPQSDLPAAPLPPDPLPAEGPEKAPQALK